MVVFHRIPKSVRLAGLPLIVSWAAALASSPALAVQTSPPVPAGPPALEYEGAAALGLELRRLGTSKRVLMIAAHPDDETTQLLGALALGQGAAVAYLSLTRGEGGQNSIGGELGEALGVLRTEELLAARRLDGAAQYFTRAYDFGYSKTADETLGHWPREAVLADVVAVIREFRPDVVVSVFSGTPRDGHGHHQVAGMLAREAFDAAGDASAYPDQRSRGLRPHAPARLYRLARGETPAAAVNTGSFDPLLGRSHFQIAMASRSRHRSQDMGRPEPPGDQWTGVLVVAQRAGDSAAGVAGAADTRAASLFAGLDTTLAARAVTATRAAPAGAAAVAAEVAAGLVAYQEEVDAIRAAYNALAPERLVPSLARAAGLLDGAGAALDRARPADWSADLRFHLALEREKVRDALGRAAGLVLDAVAGAGRVVPGGAVDVTLGVWNGGAGAVTVAALDPVLPAGWTAAPLGAAPPSPWVLAPGGVAERRFRITIPADAPPTEPYYLRAPREGSLYAWPAEPGLAGRPFEPAPLRARARVEVAGQPVELIRDAEHLEVDRRAGEVRRPVLVVPAVTVELEPPVLVLPVEDASHGVAAAGAGGNGASAAPTTTPELPLRLRLQAHGPAGAAGTLRLELPSGWAAEPAAVPLRFDAGGDERRLEVAVRPPPGVIPGAYTVAARFDADDGRVHRRGFRLVDYPHTTPRAVYRDAAASVTALSVRVPAGLRVGYIAGAGDDVPAALAQLGVAVELLDEDALAGGELDAYHAIVTGVRAYEVRPDLVAHNRRLLEYVERGGTMVVQYSQYAFGDGDFAPYPISMARPHDRVTDHEAEVRFLEPEHRLLSAPNRIGPSDFDGWIQERGLYFLRSWDGRYSPLLEMSDPGEPPLRGGLLAARYGEGTYIYTGLAFFRQLPAGVPGAYRLFANLLSAGVVE